MKPKTQKNNKNRSTRPSLSKTKSSDVKVLVFSGYGLNCEEETKYAFELAGGSVDIVHINDLILGVKKIKNYDILAFPGGFSFGDDTGSGRAFANKVRNHLWKDIEKFINEQKLIIGICNGFQIITNLGILPGALMWNEKARYIDRWVDLKISKNNSPWLKGVNQISLPIAHGEGKYYADPKTFKNLKKDNRIAFKYIKGEICEMTGLSKNPNGSLDDVAGVLSENGNILGMMPHPERGLFVSQMPHFPYLKEKSRRDGKTLAKHGPGFQIFKNAIDYVKNK